MSSSDSYNPNYHFLWLLLIPLLLAGGCFYNRKYRNNNTVCPKTSDKKYEVDNVVNMEEGGSKTDNRDLAFHSESNESVKTTAEPPRFCNT